jgi:hypothetical protein
LRKIARALVVGLIFDKFSMVLLSALALTCDGFSRVLLSAQCVLLESICQCRTDLLLTNYLSTIPTPVESLEHVLNFDWGYS